MSKLLPWVGFSQTIGLVARKSAVFLVPLRFDAPARMDPVGSKIQPVEASKPGASRNGSPHTAFLRPLFRLRLADGQAPAQGPKGKEGPPPFPFSAVEGETLYWFRGRGPKCELSMAYLLSLPGRKATCQDPKTKGTAFGSLMRNGCQHRQSQQVVSLRASESIPAREPAQSTRVHLSRAQKHLTYYASRLVIACLVGAMGNDFFQAPHTKGESVCHTSQRRGAGRVGSLLAQGRQLPAKRDETGPPGTVPKQDARNGDFHGET